MVAVILKSKSTHYADTKKMLDYGYQYVNTEKGNTTGNSTTTTAKQETAGKWVQDNGSWRYEFADGTKAVGTIYTIDAADFGFDPDGKMVTGWKMFGTDLDTILSPTGRWRRMPGDRIPASGSISVQTARS